MKAVSVVAHPDDCVIFGMAFILAHLSWSWQIIYVTHRAHDSRAQELSRFWQQHNVKTVFLGYEDDPRDNAKDLVSFDCSAAKSDIQRKIHDQDIVLSHNHQGEYGHVHHKFVNTCVADHRGLVEFGWGLDQPGVEYWYPKNQLKLDDLPQHKKMIEIFLGKGISGYYTSWYRLCRDPNLAEMILASRNLDFLRRS